MSTLHFFKKTFPNFALATLVTSLNEELKDCKTILDVGCGAASPIRFFKKNQFAIGVDRYDPALRESKKNHIHDIYKKIDVRQIRKHFGNRKFDAVIALDVIEHLKKNEGISLLKDMEKLANKKIIIFTPQGFIPQHDEANELQEHLSGWSIKDFTSRGYRVAGMYGWKLLRGHAQLRFRPKVLWGVLSELSHYFWTHEHPKQSYALFAVKTIV